MGKIDDLVAQRHRGADVQPITWRRSNWAEVWDHQPALPGRCVLDLIESEVLGEGAGTIRRSWVRSLGDGDPATFLSAVTIWGYGNYVRRGRPALRAMLSTPGLAELTRNIIEASRLDPAAGFSALFDGRGRARIARLGIAFGTKALHFAGYDYAKPRPLVLDARVYRAVQRLDPTAPVPDPSKRTTGSQYRAYCAWAGDIAQRNCVEPELVEYALFLHGAR